ncbi:MAG: hypothetical protein ABSE62_04900 [Chthoniobacteraceae bacterium]|jgi:hypothetical protein
MSRPIIINAEVTAAIREVAEYADAHRFSIQDLFKMKQTGQRIGDDPHYRTVVPYGFICCFSVEEQPFGLCRHISISINEDGTDRGVNTIGAWMICEAFGFWGSLDDCVQVEIENLPDGRPCVHLMQLYHREKTIL